MLIIILYIVVWVLLVKYSYYLSLLPVSMSPSPLQNMTITKTNQTMKDHRITASDLGCILAPFQDQDLDLDPGPDLVPDPDHTPDLTLDHDPARVLDREEDVDLEQEVPQHVAHHPEVTRGLVASKKCLKMMNLRTIPVFHLTKSASERRPCEQREGSLKMWTSVKQHVTLVVLLDHREASQVLQASGVCHRGGEVV
jgi:hypothetical protein